MFKCKREALGVICLGLALVFLTGATEVMGAPKEKITLVYWSHCTEKPKWISQYAVLGEEFNKLHPEIEFKLEAVPIPYDGYLPKYMSALQGRKGAPDIFYDGLYNWVERYPFAEPMPEDLAKRIEEYLVPQLRPVMYYKDTPYAIPHQFSNDCGEELFINVDMFTEAGLDPNRPPKTREEFVEYAKKLTKIGENGEIVRAGYQVRHKGYGVGITSKFLPWLYMFGGKWFSWEEKKASGYINSEEAIAAVKFYTDFVTTWKISSTRLPNPVEAFAGGAAAMITREMWLIDWLKENAPDINYKVFPLPEYKKAGIHLLFAYTDMVYKYAPEKHKEWAWKFLEWANEPNSKRSAEHRLMAGTIPIYKQSVRLPAVAGRPDYETFLKVIIEEEVPVINHLYPATTDLALVTGEALQKVLYGKETAEEACNSAAREMDAILEEWRSE